MLCKIVFATVFAVVAWSVKCEPLPIRDIEFSCKEKLSKVKSNTTSDPTSLVIMGPPREELNENWRNFRVNDEERLQTRTLVLANCYVPHPDVLGDVNRFTELTNISITDVGLMDFDFRTIVNNVRVRTLILDDNPIRELRGDAQFSLHHLSLRNTSMEGLPDAKLDIMKQLITLDVTGQHFKVTHDQACSMFSTLEEFNARKCVRELAPKVDTIRKETNRTKDGPTDDTNGSFGTKLQPNFLILLLLSCISRKWSWSCTSLLIIGLCFNLSTAHAGQVTDLWLESRGISESQLQDELVAHPNLGYLHLRNNSLTSLDIQSDTLRLLDVSDNQIATIEDEDLKHVPSLRKLFLSGNQLEEINWDLDQEQLNLVEVDLSNNTLLKAVRIKSQSLEVISLAYNDLDFDLDLVELHTPQLTLLDLRFAKGAIMEKEMMKNICQWILHENFRASYIREDGTADFYTCSTGVRTEQVMMRAAFASLDSNSNHNLKRPESKQKQLAGCQYSTLRIHPDDVVLSKDEYFWLNVAFASLCACVLVMSLTLVWLTLRWIKDETTGRQHRLIQI